jgi:hypothetical protein
MAAPIFPVFASWLTVLQDPGAVLSGLFFAAIFTSPFWISYWHYNAGRQETALKRQMVDRGMSADEIIAILSGGKPPVEAPKGGEEAPEGSVDLTYACEVVVKSDGEWHTGLILKRDAERYLVHYVGTEMSDNEWVTTDRLRVPVGKETAWGEPWDSTLPSDPFANSRCSNGAMANVAATDEEI